MVEIKKVLVANRGEIAIRIIRACKELGIQTVAIFSQEDSGALHRQKADESYKVGEGKGPIEAYLDIPTIIQLAKDRQVDAIHPGYGFLSENIAFARACQQAGIIFIGPEIQHLEMFGNKTQARKTALASGLPVIPGSDQPIQGPQDVEDFAGRYGYPVMIKAVSGGGGKGMRIIDSAEGLEENISRARSEALSSFGDSALYVEKYIQNPKHIEVQILADQHGQLVHLYERDCSIQRRHQKVVEVAPSFGLEPGLRKKITQAAVKLMSDVKYVNAGTVEFLVSGEDFYFIEVNPRIQVEHTITELVTSVDIVRSQIQIAAGHSLHGSEMKLPKQADIPLQGYAIQCRITTEDPLNNFFPDSGRIVGYHSPGGPGVRLDAGDAYGGALISPYYDSLLVKISTYSGEKADAIDKMGRALNEMRVVGLKTNIRFLENIIHHPQFIQGDYATNFIDQTEELFDFSEPRNRGSRVLKYLADVTVNGFPGIHGLDKPAFQKPARPQVKARKLGRNFMQVLREGGPQAVVQALQDTQDVLVTDTTLRDAHQSVLATRLRSYDMLQVADYINDHMADQFSMEVWGGATFDVAYNFLREDPWQRLDLLREALPDIPLQMLFRAANGVGYKNYPDNLNRDFIHEAARRGIDVFRIFDALNWLENLKGPIQWALETGKIVEGALCYTGDILDPGRSHIYTLDYYLDKAKALEAMGVHILCIKDMSGILKPEAAYRLVKALKAEVDLPIHLHTHDTSSNGNLTYVRAIQAGVDIVDTCNAALAGQNSQPDTNALYYALQGTDRQLVTDPEINDQLQGYWQDVRCYYQAFESDLKQPWTGVYRYEIPGGQYSNLRLQAQSLGLGHRFDEVLDMYQRVNQLFGDIIKVTPSSKVVGDMAIYMVSNDLDEVTVIERGEELDFPDSVVSFFRGEIGQPESGLNQALQAVVLKGQAPLTDRPGALLADYDYDQARSDLQALGLSEPTQGDLLAYGYYPKVFKEYLDFQKTYGDVSKIDSPSFFYGLRPHESTLVELEAGKVLLVELTSIGDVDTKGERTLYFNLNGMPEQSRVRDQSAEASQLSRRKKDPEKPLEIGAQMPGRVYAIEVAVGDEVALNDTLLVTEAMKMETAIKAPQPGRIKSIHVALGDTLEVNDLLIEMEEGSMG